MSEMKTLTLNDKTYDGFVDPVARTLASASAVINSASGESVTLHDASDVKLYGLNIYGRTTQEGVPTPDAPVDLVSVGDGGSIAVNVTGNREAQNMTVATPDGLPGIPVSSGGNYTDANGQQWICDEIDLEKGVYVQRVGKWIFDGSIDETWIDAEKEEFEDGVYYVFLGLDAPSMAYCTHYMFINGAASAHKEYRGCFDIHYKQVRFNAYGFADVGEFRAFLSSNPLTVAAPLAAPIETPLSTEEIAAYAALHTYREHTTVSNDASAHMELEYVMDAKKYIDSLITGGIAPATVE